MKKAYLLLLAVSAVLFYANVVFAQEIKVGGKNYQFSDVLAETRLIVNYYGYRRVVNFFDGKIVTMRFMPGSARWQQLSELSKIIWGLSKLDFHLSIFDDYDPFYRLEGTILFDPNTKFGTVRIDILAISYGQHDRLNKLSDIWNKVLVMAEKSKQAERPMCIEMTGRLYLSDAVQEIDVKTLGESEWKLIFDPQSAELVDCSKK